MAAGCLYYNALALRVVALRAGSFCSNSVTQPPTSATSSTGVALSVLKPPDRLTPDRSVRGSSLAKKSSTRPHSIALALCRTGRGGAVSGMATTQHRRVSAHHKGRGGATHEDMHQRRMQ